MKLCVAHSFTGQEVMMEEPYLVRSILWGGTFFRVSSWYMPSSTETHHPVSGISFLCKEQGYRSVGGLSEKGCREWAVAVTGLNVVI